MQDLLQHLQGLSRFAEHLENLQLAGKSEVQRAFLKAQREQHESVD